MRHHCTKVRDFYTVRQTKKCFMLELHYRLVCDLDKYSDYKTIEVIRRFNSEDLAVIASEKLNYFLEKQQYNERGEN